MVSSLDRFLFSLLQLIPPTNSIKKTTTRDFGMSLVTTGTRAVVPGCFRKQVHFIVDHHFAVKSDKSGDPALRSSCRKGTPR